VGVFPCPRAQQARVPLAGRQGDAVRPRPRTTRAGERRAQELQRRYRDEVTRDRDWATFASKSDLRAELAELRFPWEPPRPEHKPNNLPLPTIGTLFKGREPFLDDLRTRLGVPDGKATAIVNRLAVQGLGGVGKTRVAVEYAWRHADDYTALLFVSAPTLAEMRTNLANLVGVLGTPAETASLDEQLTQVLHWLEANPGWLLIVDNVDTEEAARGMTEMRTTCTAIVESPIDRLVRARKCVNSSPLLSPHNERWESVTGNGMHAIPMRVEPTSISEGPQPRSGQEPISRDDSGRNRTFNNALPQARCLLHPND
jgi:hypothetical protein